MDNIANDFTECDLIQIHRGEDEMKWIFVVVERK